MHGGLLGVAVCRSVHESVCNSEVKVKGRDQKSRSAINVKEKAGGLTPT